MTGSLASVHPELIPEWSEKNLPLTPDKITFGSNKRVWWKGACGHEWETSVKARSKGEKCPICSGARVIEGINDLATLKPLLAQEWSKKNKLKPTEVSVASHKKIIWKCKHGHEWEASVKSRTVNGTVRLGGNAKIAETSGTLLFQPVPVGADVRIVADIHCSKDLMTWRLRTLNLRLSGQKEIIP